MIRMLVAGSLLIFGAGAFVWWRYSVPAVHPGSDAILVDTSDSQSRLQACAKVNAIAQLDMNDRAMGRGATITLFGLGGPATADEPVMMGTFTVPDTTAVMGGPGAATDRQQEVLSQIAARCKEIPLTTVSPLFESMKRVIGFLQRQDGSGATLHAITDGEETEVKEMKEAFDQKPGTNIKLPAVINNDRVRVEICGTAETIGTVALDNGKQVTKTRSRNAVRADREIEVWQRAFSQPALVHITPYCAQASVSTISSSQIR